MTPQPDSKALLERIRSRFDQADKGVHKRFRDRSDKFYALYRNYTEWKDGLPVDARDRDLGLREGQREWGATLFIPFSFATVETVISRMLASTPRVICKPRNPDSAANSLNMKLVVDSQFENIDYELRLQDVARDALILGVGFQKTYWNKNTDKGFELQQNPYGQWVATSVDRTLFDDPVAERIDPYDLFWDPSADDINKCDWIIHRTWRSTDYCKRMFERGVWKYDEKEDADHATRDLEFGDGGAGMYKEAWENRMKVDGYPNFKTSSMHEVWEYHDGRMVVTVLNRKCIVQAGPNPAWHRQFPFQAYRPTRKPGQMVGIGEIEPIVDLQEEINTLRSQRRDNATFVLQQAFFYSEGMIDPGDFKFGPGMGIPVQGDPREVIFPAPVRDIPASGYQEESALLADIMRTTGIDDTANGAGSVQQTATGTQLVYQAQTQRIKQKTRNLEVELVKAAGRQFVALNQQHIVAARSIPKPIMPQPGQPDARWSWVEIGPAELQGEFDVQLEGGTMAPPNVPQDRQDAQTWLGLTQNPLVNPQMAVGKFLEKMGVDHPEHYLAPQQPTVPAEAIDRIGQMLAQANAVDPSVFAQAKAAALEPPEAKK